MIIVDECVSREQLERVLKHFGYEAADKKKVLELSKSYPGMPDKEIIKHFINKDTKLVTSDRVMHNQVINAGYRSIFIDQNGNILNKKLSDIRIPVKNSNEKNNELMESYLPEKTEIHKLIMPESEHQLKKYRTKRRRIRNHFEGLENVRNIDVTLSKSEMGNKVLTGMQIRVISNNGMKALDASENYVLEKESSLRNTEEVPFIYALIIIMRLMLHSKKLTIYYDENTLKKSFQENGHYFLMLEEIKIYFNEIVLIPVRKGKQIEKMRKKLAQLIAEDPGNEIVTEEIGLIKDKLMRI